MGLHEHPPQKLFLWCVLLLSIFYAVSLQLNCMQSALIIDFHHRPTARQPQRKWNKTQTGQNMSINIY